MSAEKQVGSVGLNLAIFGAFVLVTLVLVYRAGRTTRTTSDYYAAGRGFTGPQNGVAIAGDYLSAASFLGIAGAIAVNGYDGFLYSIGFLVAWLVALLLVAELMRNTGRFTMGDVLAYRMRQRPVRAAAATSTLVVSAFYLLAQMAGAGGLIALLLQIPAGDRIGQGLVIVVVGTLMIVYVLVGGMKGTTYVQIIKAVLLLVGAAVMAAWVLGVVGLDVGELLERAAERSPHGTAIFEPGLQYTNPVDFISLALACAGDRGAAAHHHALLHRPERRRGATVGGVGDLADRRVLPVHAGTRVRRDGAAAPGDGDGGEPEQRRTAAGLPPRRGVPARRRLGDRLRHHPGGRRGADDHRVGIVRPRRLRQRDPPRCRVATGGGAGGAADRGGRRCDRDRRRDRRERAERRVPRRAGVRGGGVGEPADTPVLAVLGRFNTTGALCSIYGGLVTSVALIVFSPAVSGKPADPTTGRSASMLQGVDFHWFPLDNPGLVSIPLSFLLGAVGTVLGGRRPDAARRYAEMEVRALTGAGAERATAPERATVAH